MKMLLSDHGQQWKDINVSYEEWMKGDIKKTLTFGQLPKLEDGSFVLFQSNAILRYLGRKHEAYGKDDAECALIDMMNDSIEDLRIKYIRMIYQDYENGKDRYIQELPDQLKYFEKILASNPKGFLVGDKMSYADYNLFDLLLNQKVLSPPCLDSFPALKSYVDKIAVRPKIKAYMESDAYKKLPINGNGKQ